MKAILVTIAVVTCLFALHFESVNAKAVDLPIDQKELEALDYMKTLNDDLNERTNKLTEASWAYASNITDHNLEVRNRMSEEHAKFLKELGIKLKEYPYKSFKDEDLKRKFKKLVKLNYALLPEEQYKEMLDAISNMESNYAKVRICSFKDSKKCDFQLEPELTEILGSSRDEAELRYYWLEWYNKAGKPVREHFQKYVDLNKEAAKLNGFKSGAEVWLDEYEVPDFEAQVDAVIQQLRPLYEQLHGYVRHKLVKHYGSDIVKPNGAIPMHLLGNMWGQTWDEIMDITAPYPSKPQLDVSEEMKKQGYNPVKMFEMGDEFFQSLNMTKLPQIFWEKSVLEKPSDGRDLVCHASAWDFYKKDDVRIKQCTRVTMDQFFTVHHELGHIQYYLQYQHQPYVYREGANPGFHEAVGDVLSLSVSSPKHLTKIGLLKNYEPDQEALVNQYFKSGLAKFVFLPFAYTIDKYRWGIFRGEIKPEEYNCKFWELRHKFSGIEPPVARTEEDLDAPAKYHVSADVEYLRYLVSYIVQFQFHKALCEKAGQFVPGDAEKTLNNCDIYQSAEAGNALKEMLSLGSSKPWPDAMEVLTGQRQMDAGALLEYFKPLSDFLIKYNKENDVPIGWGPSDKFACSA
ncbi:angiotensin-converting enzyme-like [Culicoides brevitarsis]|uniref:angiotensin-converting enzyme-like n=1 Tax=Culicoides brevitarsis TaxID=469753 RepID=UPI00307BA063